MIDRPWMEKVQFVVSAHWPDLAQFAARNGRSGSTWIEAQVRQESANDPSARSSVGAVGLLQLMPRTAEELGLRVEPGEDDRLDPYKNLSAGVRYLKLQYAALPEIVDPIQRLLWSFACYNAGRGFIDFDGGKVADTCLELARRDDPRWQRWDVGRMWLMHRDCALVVAGRGKVYPDYRQVWGYVSRIQEYASIMFEEAR